ncbi:MAG TPA: glycosyltransferase family 87 protein [Propionibacteriaceae bacterium]|nr:glycosyltransferase family 87 protein [Propionibacteriaceae bacterium]
MTKAADPDIAGSPRPHTSWRRLALVWLVARVIVFGAWAGFGLTTQGDVLYYWSRLHLMATGTPLSRTLVEYPTPVVWFLDIGYWLAGQSRPAYVVVFVVGMLVLDLVFAVALWRAGGTRRAVAVLFWVVFTFVMGPTTYMRFDLVPAVLGGLAVLSLLAPREGVAGSLVGLGAAFKLWPALLWPGTLVQRRRIARSALGFVAVGGGLAVVSLVAGGWSRLVSPLVWQQARGLQIESVWATPLMLVRALFPGRYDVALSKWQAYEITGDGTSAALAASSVATVLGYLVIVATYVLWLRRRDRTVVEAALIMVLVVTVTIVTNKTFSPQYMMWLGGPVGGLIVAAGRSRPVDTAPSWLHLRAVAVSVLALTLVTQLVYPVLYQPLVHGGPFLLLATVVLAVRNLALVAFLVWLGVLVWRMLLAPVSPRTDGGPVTGPSHDDTERKVGP